MADKKLKILLVDDDAMLREMYAEIFQNANYEVIQANDGIEGLDMATKELPDVIFTGIVMPRMDGFEMMEALKKTVMTEKIPVVISSHMGRGSDQERANALGAKDFIIRDVTRPIEVVERIGSLFAQAGEEYKINFDKKDPEIQRIAKDLNIQSDFLCLDCSNDLAIRMKVTNASDRVFEAQFVCPKCGWIAK